MWNFLKVLVAVCALCAFGWSSPAQGEEEGADKTQQEGYGPKTEQEKADALLIRQEDERERQKNGEVTLTILEGKIYLMPEATESTLPWVVGRLVVKSQVYLMLLDSTDLFGQLQAQNGKSVRLSGRVRVGGKYFVVVSFITPLNVPSSPPKRGGM